MSTPEPQPSTARSGTRDSALIALAVVIGTAFILTLLYGLRGTSIEDVLGRLTVAALTAGAATMTGGLLGFLFGIPRTPQQGEDGERDGTTENKPAYRPNTSLEQISDWLTKILVGVGLTQIASLSERLGSLGVNLGKAFGGQPVDEAFVVTLVLMLLVAGFLFGFLWTRIYLPGAFRAADLNALVVTVKQEFRKQADTDAEVLALVDQQLGSAGQTAVGQEKLTEAIRAASVNARLFVFERASSYRSKNWQDPATKAAMERTIPIFRGLIQSGDSPILHRYYGQLGFALKDQRAPDWKAAEEALVTAIRMRGPWRFNGWVAYELNRAICRLVTDPEYQQKKPSEASTKALILEDLRAACQGGLQHVVVGEQPIVEWLQLNDVSSAMLARSR